MMGIVEEIQQWGKDPRMDHGYRARTPGYREYADNVINEMKESYLANSGIPIVADAAGAKMDYEMFRDHPESRTLPNFLLAGAAALPFVPRMAKWGKSKIPSKKQYPVPENWVDGYHGTRAEALTGTTPFKQMPDSDFGIHMGSTPEQANLRLKQTSVDDPAAAWWGIADPNAGPAQVQPMKLNLGNSIEMEDMNWGFPEKVVSGLKKVDQVADNSKLMRALNKIVKKYDRRYPWEEWGDPNLGPVGISFDRLAKKGHQANKSIAKNLKRHGIDSITYKNTIESANPRVPDNSFIMMDPADIRSRFAKFNPRHKKSGNPMAGLAALGLTGFGANQLKEEENVQ